MNCFIIHCYFNDRNKSYPVQKLALSSGPMLKSGQYWTTGNRTMGQSYSHLHFCNALDIAAVNIQCLSIPLVLLTTEQERIDSRGYQHAGMPAGLQVLLIAVGPNKSTLEYKSHEFESNSQFWWQFSVQQKMKNTAPTVFTNILLHNKPHKS